MSNYTAEDSETIARLRHDLALAREERVNLQEENDRLERILQAPLSLKDLEVAWEAAEQADECRKGDVLVSKSWKGGDNFRVYSARSAKDLPPGLRILSRAPREPWVELAGVLHDEAPRGVVDVDHLAERLHAAGVRVTGGDES